MKNIEVYTFKGRKYIATNVVAKHMAMRNTILVSKIKKVAGFDYLKDNGSVVLDTIDDEKVYALDLTAFLLLIGVLRGTKAEEFRFDALKALQ